ncbi:hypothetical protein L2088_02380 [Pseudomonas protegens]|uniref:hypothetical protein n=1 Tax=Pseudomonas protegens TaxID=380021 RepID=UPI00202454A0|nr:hypothetical protein [Pseudomonas protegens]MCL9653541.1 hypothetical protein [Pseudomonas protegens]
MSKLGDVTACQNAVEAANLALSTAVKKAWPTGCVVHVRVGRGKSDIKVIGHGDYWSRTGELRGINPKTQKSRWFHYSMIIEGASHE